MVILGLDTCLAACSVAIIDGEIVLGERSEPMARGHQERLPSMVEETMRQAGVDFPSVEKIGVTVGPGSFTGVRVGLAFAKGLALGLGRRVAGVGTLEALAASAWADGAVAAVIDAGRGAVFIQTFADGGQSMSAARSLPVSCAVSLLESCLEKGPLTIVGPGAGLFAALPGLPDCFVLDAPRPSTVAILASRSTIDNLSPLYLRAPDAVAAA